MVHRERVVAWVKISIRVKHHDCISSLDLSSELHSDGIQWTVDISAIPVWEQTCALPSSLPKLGSPFRPLYLSTLSSSLGLKLWESPWPLLFHILHPIHHNYHELGANLSRYTQNLTTSHPHIYQPGAGTSMFTVIVLVS